MRFTSLIRLGFAGAVNAAAGGGIAEVLGGWKDNPCAGYPTQFTRDIIPVCQHPPPVVVVVNWSFFRGGIEEDTLAQ
jgi:hypothetical protein